MHAPPPPVAPSPMLARCLLLALLLHVWLVLLLGNAPGGTARQGDGVWGSINVTLRGPESKGAAEVPVPEVRDGPVGSAAVPRVGGAVRERAAVDTTEPGAAQLGEWAVRPAPLAGRVAEAPLAPIEPVQPVADLPPPPPAPPGRVLEERQLPQGPALQAPLARAAPLQNPLPLAPAAPLLRPPVSLTPAPVEAPPADAPAPEAPTQRLTAPPAAPVAPVAPLTPGLSAAESLPLAPAAPALAPALSPSAGPAPMAPGAPDAGSRVGADAATPPSASASAPRLNLELARPRGGELSRGGSKGVLPLLPRPPELSDKLARDIEKSAKGDCRTAHAGNGLLAVGPLLADAARKEGGCKW